MKIGCLVSSLSPKTGGIFESVRGLSCALQAQPSTEVHVLGTSDAASRKDLAGWSPLPVHAFPVRGSVRFGYAPGLLQKLLELDVDILLTHGLWMYSSIVTLAWHRRTQRPFIVHPHGMLDPWAMNQSYLKKSLAGFLYENSHLQKAACLRALSDAEVESIRGRGLRNPVCVLANGILPPEPTVAPSPPWRCRIAVGRKVLLYLGRLHPKKGLLQLLIAWKILRQRNKIFAQDWTLVIAGWSQDGHEKELGTLASQLGIASEIHFSGPLFNQDKWAAYANADAFVLPSFSEGLPMVVLEACAHRLPVMMTSACHFPTAFETGAALRVEPEPSSLADGLERLFSMNEAGLKRMGDLGHQLVVERFNWSAIGAQMHEICRWVLGETDRPACVFSADAETSPHAQRNEPTLA